jgi:hypothetical protein
MAFMATAILVAAGLTSPSSAAGSAVTSPGSAVASASLLTVGPSYEGLAVTVTAAESIASYQSGESQATSSLIDAASLSSLASSVPSLPITEGEYADSASGAATKTGGVPLLGTESAQVNPSPESAASDTTLVDLNLPGLLSVEGRSGADVDYQAGAQQSASASSSLTVNLAGGKVVLDGLSWQSTQQTGGSAGGSSTFSIASVEVDGHALPVATAAELEETVTAVNRALAAYSLEIVLPQESTDPSSGTVAMGGLDVRLSRSALTNSLLGPLLSPLGTVEGEINKALAAGGSGLASVAGEVGTGELLAGLVMGILAGAGQVNLVLGGSSADTELAPTPISLLGNFGLGSDAIGGSSGVGTSIPPLSNASLPVSSAASPGATAPAGGTPPSASAPASAPQAQLTAVVHCTSTSPSGHSGCWQGAATWAASALLVVGIGLFAADAYVGRRRRFRVVKEVLP